MKKIFRIGTRGSRLALTQAREIQRRLQQRFPKIKFVLEAIRTTGDEFQSVEIFKTKNTGVFTKTIEKKLINGTIDLAVHSLKDLPTVLPEKLCLTAFPKRLDAQDVLISTKRYGLRTLPQGAIVGTGSPRRKRQLAIRRPDLQIVDVRGNLDTRIQKVLKEKKFDAIVVARAGLIRLKKYLKYAHPLPPTHILPAVGQGALGLETRKKDIWTKQMVRTLNHAKTEKLVSAERHFLHRLRGGCRVPVGIHSRIHGNKILLKAAVFSVKSNQCLCSKITGPVKNFRNLAGALAKRLLQMGATKFLNEARSE